MSSVSRLRCLLPIVLCGIYCLFSPAIAGTVHLKNGRVIRGPVVARDDDGVVIALEGGKMRIYKRFIAAVVYDDSDIAIKEKPAARRDKPAVASTASPESAIAGLPEDPRELLERLRQEAAVSVPPVRPSIAVSAGPVPGLKSVSAEVENEAAGNSRKVREPAPVTAELAATIEGPAAGSTLRPPSGWKLDRIPGLVRFVEPSRRPFPASIEWLQLDGSMPATADCLQVLRQEHRSMLNACETLDERFSLKSAGQEVFEITSRGRFEGRQVVVYQRLINSDGNAWLLSAFRDSRDPDVGRLLAQSIESLRFAAGENVSKRQ
ncbi:MAG: hypothetical protein VYB34_10405 [Planctomycetota bacterium]|nr:hypothetical protein [Planctomycetota bacterium]